MLKLRRTKHRADAHRSPVPGPRSPNASPVPGPRSPTEGRSRATLDELLALRYRAPRLPAAPGACQLRAGAHLSRIRARGVDYAESRIYQPGDDIRVMDWRVTARTGRPHTKLFSEERERSLMLLLDMNPAMRFGTRQRFKSVQALRAAALAAWMAVRGGDRVGALAFGRVQAVVHPRGGPRGALALLGAMLRWDQAPDDAGEEPLSAALRRCLQLAHGGSRVLLLSDGLSCDEAARPLLMRLRSHVEVTALNIVDALESAAPAAGVYSFDIDHQRRRVDLTGSAARDEFQQALGRGQRELAALCTRCGVPLQRIDTSADPANALLALLGRPRAVGRG
ncbi:MAG TPA: DUF58 domain-containing protein [Rhodanobacteraceae bacterium]|nr:DUF58 domain-containing protein [Rhodanobacteraceae bacterium]